MIKICHKQSPIEIASTRQRTKDFELCLDGGKKGLTLVGDSLSIECRLCEDCRLSGCGVAETGRNFGAGDMGHKYAWKSLPEREHLICVIHYVQKLIPFVAATESGDVSSIKDVDMLELLRVVSSCHPENDILAIHRKFITTTIKFVCLLLTCH